MIERSKKLSVARAVITLVEEDKKVEAEPSDNLATTRNRMGTMADI